MSNYGQVGIKVRGCAFECLAMNTIWWENPTRGHFILLANCGCTKSRVGPFIWRDIFVNKVKWKWITKHVFCGSMEKTPKIPDMQLFLEQSFKKLHIEQSTPARENLPNREIYQIFQFTLVYALPLSNHDNSSLMLIAGFYALLFMFGTCGNAAILAVVHHVKGQDPRSRHNTTLTYICILSIVDFLSMLPIPMTIIDQVNFKIWNPTIRTFIFRSLDFGCLTHLPANCFASWST